MSGNRLNSTLAERLRRLEGEAFEEAVCLALELNLHDFQRIPDKPQGDGGLDGLSHGGTRVSAPTAPLFKR